MHSDETNGETVRLQKYMAMCGVASRRASETIILDGRVKINGIIADIGAKVRPGSDAVELDGAPLEPPRETHTYILMNKPRGYVTTLSDEFDRKCVADLLAGVKARVVPVGRLDRESEGLLLFTDDGSLTYKLTHPKHHIAKTYKAVIRGEVTPETIEELAKPMEIDGYTTEPASVKTLGCLPDRTIVSLTIFEGRNRQIRRMCEALGLELMRLKRERIGDLKLGDVKAGKWRSLTPEEVEYLKRL